MKTLFRTNQFPPPTEQLGEEIINLHSVISNDSEFLEYLESLMNDGAFDIWLERSKNYNIPPFVVSKAKKLAKANGTSYGEELLRERIEWKKKELRKKEKRLEKKITLHQKLNGVIKEQPPIEADSPPMVKEQAPIEADLRVLESVVEPTPTPQQPTIKTNAMSSTPSNGLENSPILKAIGSPLTLDQAKQNIKKILIHLHPDSKQDNKHSYEKVYAKVTELEVMLENNWSMFDPLTTHPSTHIKEILAIESPLLKYQFSTLVL